MPLDHSQIHVSNLEASKKFYLAALAPLGFKQLLEFNAPEGVLVGFGVEGKLPNLWIHEAREGESPSSRVHLAFAAENREQVDKFHEAALKVGAKDNGGPGERAYVPGYYAAFAFDPDGNNIEVVHV